MPKRARSVVWLFHMKVKYDPTWTATIDEHGRNMWELLCDALCGNNYHQVLCVAEKLDTNAHVHIQGETTLFQDEIAAIKKEWKEKHYMCMPGRENRNPFKQCQKLVDEKGYQYMSKEGHPPLFVRGFTQEQLDKMKAESDAVVAELKFGLRDVLHAKTYAASAERALWDMIKDARAWYKENDRQYNAGLKFRVLNIMDSHPQKTPAWDDYINEILFKR